MPQSKVVWPNIAKSINAAVVAKHEGKPVIPQHIVTLLRCSTLEEAHYCCAVLNSSPFNLAVQSYSQKGGKSFGTPHILDYVYLPLFSDKSRLHLKLAELSRAAHKAAAAGSTAEVKKIEEEVDRIAAKLWGLTDGELAEIKQALEET